jgi:thiol-disulfide isomerase/thioredoxin
MMSGFSYFVLQPHIPLPMKTMSITFIFVFLPLVLSAQPGVGTEAPKLAIDEIVHGDPEWAAQVQDPAGQIVVLDFWAIWCVPCVAAIPDLNAIAVKYRDRGVVFVSITDDPAVKLQNFLAATEVSYPVVRDEDGSEFKKFGVRARPRYFIINREGTIVFSGNHIGEALVEEVLQTGTVDYEPAPAKSIASGNRVVTNGGFAPGQDPLYNGMRFMKGIRPVKRYTDIRQFIIRPSVETEFGGNGWRTAGKYVGVTYSGGTLEELLSFLRQLPSPLWIENKTGDTTRYDVVYWQKAAGLSEALAEIEAGLLDGLELTLDSVLKTIPLREVRPAANVQAIPSGQIPEGARNAYLSVHRIAAALEQKTTVLHAVAPALADTFVPIRSWPQGRRLMEASPREIVELLAMNGIKVVDVEREMVVYELVRK